MKWTAMRQRDYLETGVWKHLHESRVGWIVNRIRGEQQRSVRPIEMLDVGCGDGVITRRLRLSLPDAAIRAVDLDPVRLRRATAHCEGVSFCQGHIGALPFPDDSFDVVLCHHVIEHVADDVEVLAECRRVLRPNGLLLLGIPQEDAAIGRLLRLMHRRMYAAGEHIHFYSIATMRDLLATAGFTSVEHAKFGFLFPFYYLHVLLVWNRVSFALGHRLSQWFDATADSLIFAARKQTLAAH